MSEGARRCSGYGNDEGSSGSNLLLERGAALELQSDDALHMTLANDALRAASLRRLAGRGSAVDALVVAFAEPDGTVLTWDVDDVHALAQHARTVAVERV